MTVYLCHTPSIALAEAWWRTQVAGGGCQCAKGCIEVDLLHPHRKAVVSLHVIDVIVCLLVLSRLCCNSDCGLPVDGRSKVLEEQECAVVDVSWPHPTSIY